jgi:hypothetical protein
MHNFLLFILTAILGLVSIVIPPLLLPGEYYNSPLFPLVRTGIERFSFLTMSLLIITGMLPGILSHRSAWIWGLGSVFLLPFLAISEMIVEPTSHNLWPIEFTVTYGFISIFATVGAVLGRFIKERKGKTEDRKGTGEQCFSNHRRKE